MSQVLRLARTGHVLVCTLNRPDRHNALNHALLRSLEVAVSEAERDPDIRAAVLTGAGSRAFCAGADLDELAGLSTDEAADALAVGQSVFRAVERATTPFIAAVEGVALGGGFELALSCHVVIVARNARLALPETGLGLIPGYGGTQRLTRQTGAATAMYHALTGEPLTADRAFAVGLTPFAPVPDGEALSKALEVGAVLASKGPRALERTMRAVQAAQDGSVEAGLRVEAAAAAAAIGSEEGQEGIRAFRAKRAAAWALKEPNAQEGQRT